MDSEDTITIEITFPTNVAPSLVKNIIDGCMKQTNYSCEVMFDGEWNGENDYLVTVDEPKALYYVGKTASAIIDKYTSNRFSTPLLTKS